MPESKRTIIIDAVISSELTHHWPRVLVSEWILALEKEGWELDNIIELSCPVPQAIPEDAIPQPNVLAQRFLDWHCNHDPDSKAYPSPQTVIRSLIVRHHL